jgi:hypothetical protein
MASFCADAENLASASTGDRFSNLHLHHNCLLELTSRLRIARPPWIGELRAGRLLFFTGLDVEIGRNWAQVATLAKNRVWMGRRSPAGAPGITCMQS